VLQIIFNNGALDFVGVEEWEAGLIPSGVELQESGLARVAEVFDANGIHLEELGDLENALAEALAHEDGPVVVDALLHPSALALPSHVPFHAAKGYRLSVTKEALSGRMDSFIKTVGRNVRLV
jgi:pyruvate dehydrogenase (quinone)